MGQIVVGVDGSEHAARALRWAAREAELRRADLTAAIAWGYFDEHHTILGMGFDPVKGRADALAALESYVVDALGPDAAEGIGRIAVCDGTATGLLEAAKDAELLVVGARGLGGFKGLLLGSVSQRCMHHAEVPVAIVRGGDGAPSGRSPRIVVGIDGSEPARVALGWAAEEARLRSACLEVVHAWHLPYATGYPYATVAFDPREFEDAARAILDAAVAEVDSAALPHPVRPVLGMATGASLILKAAEGADLVVLGSRGLGSVTGFLLGSVSHQVAHHAPCPLVVVPAGCATYAPP